MRLWCMYVRCNMTYYDHTVTYPLTRRRRKERGKEEEALRIRGNIMNTRLTWTGWWLGDFSFLRLRGGGVGPKVQRPPPVSVEKKFSQLPFKPAKFRDFWLQNDQAHPPRHNSPWCSPPASHPLKTYSTWKPHTQHTHRENMFVYYESMKRKLI